MKSYLDARARGERVTLDEDPLVVMQWIVAKHAIGSPYEVLVSRLQGVEHYTARHRQFSPAYLEGVIAGMSRMSQHSLHHSDHVLALGHDALIRASEPDTTRVNHSPMIIAGRRAAVEADLAQFNGNIMLLREAYNSGHIAQPAFVESEQWLMLDHLDDLEQILHQIDVAINAHGPTPALREAYQQTHAERFGTELWLQNQPNQYLQ